MHDGTTRFRKGDDEIYHFLQVSTYAERAVLPEQNVIPIRKDAPLDVVCLVSCGVMTGAGAVINRAQVAPGSSVVVFGCGGVGLNAIQAAALMGAGKIIAVDVFDQKLEWSREFGATHLVNAGKRGPVARDPGDLRPRRRRLRDRGDRRRSRPSSRRSCASIAAARSW